MTAELQGICQFCEEKVPQAETAAHSRDCAKLAEARGAIGGSVAVGFRLRVEDCYNPLYWLELEMLSSAKLDRLDHYLRAIWLDCCGHMSEFTGNGFGSGKIAQNKKLEDAFQGRSFLVHLYDMGSTSETKITKLGTVTGGTRFPARKPIRLLFRNEPPPYQCQERGCGAPAQIYSPGWQLEGKNAPGLFCPTHAKTDKMAGEYEQVPISNSPRMGMCGYEGPAEPPY
jgi:hypothetical protein